MDIIISGCRRRWIAVCGPNLNYINAEDRSQPHVLLAMKPLGTQKLKTPRL